jgi:hypothetical protein
MCEMVGDGITNNAASVVLTDPTVSGFINVIETKQLAGCIMGVVITAVVSVEMKHERAGVPQTVELHCAAKFTPADLYVINDFVPKNKNRIIVVANMRFSPDTVNTLFA